MSDDGPYADFEQLKARFNAGDHAVREGRMQEISAWFPGWNAALVVLMLADEISEEQNSDLPEHIQLLHSDLAVYAKQKKGLFGGPNRRNYYCIMRQGNWLIF